MSCRGPVADASGLTFITGNGDVGNSNIGESFARLEPTTSSRASSPTRTGPP